MVRLLHDGRKVGGGCVCVVWARWSRSHRPVHEVVSRLRVAAVYFECLEDKRIG